MTAREGHRRKRTRGALALSLVLIVVVLAGTEALMRARPVADTSPLIVDGLPPRAVSAADPRSCLRGVEEDTVAEIQEELVTGGRVSSAQVFACPEAFDGLRIVFAGEAIGDVLHRDGGAWLQVNDDAYALETGPLGRHADRQGFNTGLSVWLPDGLHERITGVGGPDRRGDVLLLEGVLMRTDPADGGGTTLRADELTVLTPSVLLEEPLHVTQALVAGLLALGAIWALVWSRIVRNR